MVSISVIISLNRGISVLYLSIQTLTSNITNTLTRKKQHKLPTYPVKKTGKMIQIYLFFSCWTHGMPLWFLTVACF